MEINLAVIYTEYQLLQVEAIVSHYKLKNVTLIIHNRNNRVSDWLIDQALFDDVIQLPLRETSKSYKLTKKYIQYYCSVATDLLKKKKVNILIGAQDENTIFAIIKHYARPKEYWNIEDGNANYLRENFRYRLELFVKKTIFFLYGYGMLDIRYGHGLVRSDKTFRIYPKLSIDKKKSIALGELLKSYLQAKIEKVRPKIDWIEQYSEFEVLVVPDPYNSSFPEANSSNILYKFHPEYMPQVDGISYIKQHIPIEFLPWLLPNIKTIRYQVVSSSILNILVLNSQLKMQLDYTPPNNAYRFYTKNIIQEFGARIDVLGGSKS